MTNAIKFWLSILITAALYGIVELIQTWPTMERADRDGIILVGSALLTAWGMIDLVLYSVGGGENVYGPVFWVRSFNKFLNKLGDKF